MKLKNANWLFIAALLIAAACKKNDAPSLTNDSNRTTVTAWIDKQQTPGQVKRTAIAKGIKDNLQWDKSWDAKLDKGGSIVMIPIAKGYTFMNNKDKNVNNYLVIFKKATGEIKGAHIFQSLQGSQFTEKTIPGYYNAQPQDMNGTYYILTLHDVIYKELVYENNRLQTDGLPRVKEAANNRTGASCMEWYWIHTVYDSETGWIISQTETYLGMTCTSNCQPNTNTPQTTITGEPEWDCEGGSGGSSEGDICAAAADEFEAHALQETPSNAMSMSALPDGEEKYFQLTWIVAQHPFNLWRVKAVTECRYKGFIENSVYKTDVKLINTLSSNYEGPNNIVNTTWTQTSKTDVTFNNLTDHATTVSYVNGTLKHKCKIPLCNDLLDKDKIVNNHLDLEF